MNNRIKEIRKKLGLSQEEFGKRLRVTKTSISKIEAGINNPSDQTIKLICSEFNVNEEWLCTGAGGQDNMFLSEDVKYFQNIGKLGAEKNDFKKFCLNMLMGLPDEYWDCIYKEFKKFDRDNLSDDILETVPNARPKSGFDGIPSSDELLEMYPDLLKEDKKGIS